MLGRILWTDSLSNHSLSSFFFIQWKWMETEVVILTSLFVFHWRKVFNNTRTSRPTWQSFLFWVNYLFIERLQNPEYVIEMENTLFSSFFKDSDLVSYIYWPRVAVVGIEAYHFTEVLLSTYFSAENQNPSRPPPDFFCTSTFLTSDKIITDVWSLVMEAAEQLYSTIKRNASGRLHQKLFNYYIVFLAFLNLMEFWMKFQEEHVFYSSQS